MNNLFCVVAVERLVLGECPTHGCWVNGGLETVSSFDSLKDMVLAGINSKHIADILSFDGSEYEVEYHQSVHRYSGATIHINGEPVWHTADNGSGSLRWEDEC